MCLFPGSVDGYALQIDELKGTKRVTIDLKPTERIDLRRRGLGVASAIIIASCIKENRVLKELQCAPARVFAFLSVPVDTPTLSLLQSYPSLAVSGATTSEPRAPLRSPPSSRRLRSPTSRCRRW